MGGRRFRRETGVRDATSGARTSRRQARSALPLVLVLVRALSGASALAAEETRVIREIRVHPGNVFTHEETEDNIVFDLANRIRFTTREFVVERALLFSEGDVLDVDLLAASERVLRALDFINAATIRVAPVDEARVDVEVYTHDAWSIIPGYNIKSGGGLTETGATIEESNLLGFGKQVYASAIHETDVGITWTAAYEDPQVLGSRVRLSSSFQTGPLIDGFRVSVRRPFYSPDTAWSMGMGGSYLDETVRLFASGAEASRLLKLRRSATLSVARALGPRYRKLIAELRFRYDDLSYEALPGTTTPLPADELILITSLALSYEHIRWVEATRIRKMTLVEDVRLGWTLAGNFGRAGFPVPTGVRRFEGGGSYQHAVRFAEKHFLFLAASGSTQGDQNASVSASGEFYGRWLSFMTLALKSSFSHAWNLDPSKQFVLGGDNGLRGFPARRFTGDKSFLTNIEARLYSPIQVYTVAMGGVVFFDAGRAWDRSSQIDFREIAYSVGFGARLAITRWPDEPVLRIDLGWPLSEEGFALSIGVEQQF